MSLVRSTRLAVLVVTLAALSFGGCGRRGPLEAPDTPRKPAAASGSVFGPTSGRPDAEPEAPAASDRPFVLDPLI